MGIVAVLKLNDFQSSISVHLDSGGAISASSTRLFLFWLGIQTTVGSGCDYQVRFRSYPFHGHLPQMLKLKRLFGHPSLISQAVFSQRI